MKKWEINWKLPNLKCRSKHIEVKVLSLRTVVYLLSSILKASAFLTASLSGYWPLMLKTKVQCTFPLKSNFCNIIEIVKRKKIDKSRSLPIVPQQLELGVKHSHHFSKHKEKKKAKKVKPNKYNQTQKHKNPAQISKQKNNQTKPSPKCPQQQNKF